LDGEGYGYGGGCLAPKTSGVLGLGICQDRRAHCTKRPTAQASKRPKRTREAWTLREERAAVIGQRPRRHSTPGLDRVLGRVAGPALKRDERPRTSRESKHLRVRRDQVPCPRLHPCLCKHGGSHDRRRNYCREGHPLKLMTTVLSRVSVRHTYGFTG
jgi:hypothetical protein